MKASTAYKLTLARTAIKNELAVSMLIRGDREAVQVKGIRDLKHTVLLTLARNGGHLAVEPDDIVTVWVPKLPPSFQESQPHAD